MISIWVLSHPKCCEPSIILSVFAGKSISSLVSEGKVFIHPWVGQVQHQRTLNAPYLIGASHCSHGQTWWTPSFWEEKSFSASSKKNIFQGFRTCKKENPPTKNLRTKTKPRLFVGQRTWQSQSARDLRLLGGKQQSGLGLLNIYRLVKRLWDVNLKVHVKRVGIHFHLW